MDEVQVAHAIIDHWLERAAFVMPASTAIVCLALGAHRSVHVHRADAAAVHVVPPPGADRPGEGRFVVYKDVKNDHTSAGTQLQGQVAEQVLGGVAHEL